MSKKQVTPVVTYNGKRTKDFTTSRGVKLTISPAPPLINAVCKAALEMEWSESGRALPVVPTYELKIGGDASATETHEHDADSVKGNTEYERQWAAYQEAQKKFNSELNLRVMRVLVIGSVDFEITKAMEERIAAMRIALPKNPDEKKFLVSQILVFGSGDDFRSVMTTAAELSGAPAQQIDAARESFRGDTKRA